MSALIKRRVENVFIRVNILVILLDFHNCCKNVSLQKLSRTPFLKCSPLLKLPILKMLLISFSFNQAIIFCISSLALALINQYSTGLFVSHSTHRKTQLQANIQS